MRRYVYVPYTNVQIPVVVKQKAYSSALLFRLATCLNRGSAPATTRVPPIHGAREVDHHSFRVPCRLSPRPPCDVGQRLLRTSGRAPSTHLRGVAGLS
jgi:hypothetical protein